jgi:hypothetical protein
VRCASLASSGRGQERRTPSGRALKFARLLADGHDAAALEQAAINVGFDLWRAVAATYASAYLRRPANGMPCGFGLAMLDAAFRPRESTAAEERALWWPTTAASRPRAESAFSTPASRCRIPFLAGQRCLRNLWTGESLGSKSSCGPPWRDGRDGRLPDRPGADHPRRGRRARAGRLHQPAVRRSGARAMAAGTWPTGKSSASSTSTRSWDRSGWRGPTCR